MVRAGGVALIGYCWSLKKVIKGKIHTLLKQFFNEKTKGRGEGWSNGW